MHSGRIGVTENYTVDFYNTIVTFGVDKAQFKCSS